MPRVEAVRGMVEVPSLFFAGRGAASLDASQRIFGNFAAKSPGHDCPAISAGHHSPHGSGPVGHVDM
jgi:hypothetical protein